jgi:hypothetical protein
VGGLNDQELGVDFMLPPGVTVGVVLESFGGSVIVTHERLVIPTELAILLLDVGNLRRRRQIEVCIIVPGRYHRKRRRQSHTTELAGLGCVDC